MASLSQQEEEFESRMLTRIDIPITKILMSFEEFGKMVVEVMKSPKWLTEHKEQLVDFKKAMMDMEIKLRRFQDQLNESSRKEAVAPHARCHNQAMPGTPATGGGASPEFMEAVPERTGD